MNTNRDRSKAGMVNSFRRMSPEKKVEALRLLEEMAARLKAHHDLDKVIKA